MSKIENGRTARVLRDDELAHVSGGIKEVDKASGWVSPLVIRGFNPQPDPPGVVLVG